MQATYFVWPVPETDPPAFGYTVETASATLHQPHRPGASGRQPMDYAEALEWAQNAAAEADALAAAPPSMPDPEPDQAPPALDTTGGYASYVMDEELNPPTPDPVATQ